MSVVSEKLLERAARGDEQAFRALTDPHRRELEFHCYRMLGSVQDAEDILQDTLLAAWNGLAQFERRASLRTWLYRIATNRCLNALRDARRRPPPEPSAPFETPPPTRRADPGWLEPYPDDRLGGLVSLEPGPAARYETRATVELAFIAALQQLTGRQRAALVLHDVLGFRAGEVAGMLDATEESVRGALKRARATLAGGEVVDVAGGSPPAPDSPEERALVQQFVDAFVSDDVEGMVALLTDSAWLTMPPATLEYQGRTAVGAFLSAIARWRAGQPGRVLPAQRANGQPAFASYRVNPADGVATASGLIVLQLAGAQISRLTWFIGPQYVQAFGLPPTLPPL
jgi:RNA polymerase sigma-70 factor (TIGR02960 family)